jgi:DNA-binding transcriptional LysR family regulator
VVVAAPEYLERRGTPNTPSDLSNHRIVCYQYQESARQWEFMDAQGRASSVSVTGAMQMNSSLAMREAVLNGAGIMRAPTFVVGHDIQAGRLRPLLTQYKTLTLSIYAVYPQRRHLSPKVRAFVEFFAARIGEQPYWEGN